MTCFKPRRGAVLAALVIAAGLCMQAQIAAAQDSTVPAMVLSPGTKYVLDFSGSPNGGVPAGTFNNFGFSLDLGKPAQKLTVKQGDRRKDVIATYDFADCSWDQESLLERPVRALNRGTGAWVDYVDIEMIPLKQKGLIWRGGVCYGYRQAHGDWQWNLVSTPLIYDEATGRVRGRIWVKQPDVDALKLVFDYSVPTQSVSKVTVTTQDVAAQIVK
jgi:hypothetical protein